MSASVTLASSESRGTARPANLPACAAALGPTPDHVTMFRHPYPFSLERMHSASSNQLPGISQRCYLALLLLQCIIILNKYSSLNSRHVCAALGVLVQAAVLHANRPIGPTVSMHILLRSSSGKLHQALRGRIAEQ